MIVKTLALALALSAAAAPLRPRALCTPSYAPDGSYIDEGCGIVIRADGGLCVRTDYDTTSNAKVYLDECLAGSKGGSGGRWDVSLGETVLRNMEAATPDFCLTASADRKTVVAAKCKQGEKRQQWVTTLPWNSTADARVELASDRELCLAALETGAKAQLALAKCDCSTAQIFNAPNLSP